MAWDAGSERQKVAESEGERLKEASSINRSLSTLGLVINKLAGAHRQPAHVPYRDSRLTFLLQACHQLPLYPLEHMPYCHSLEPFL